VLPGDHSMSELWVRDASDQSNKMPPLARNFIDQMYIDSLARWIDGFVVDTFAASVIEVAPNPAIDIIRIQVGEHWLPEYHLTLYDLSGRLLTQKEVTAHLTYFDTRGFPSGIYLLYFERPGQRETRKVIFQH